MENVENLEDLYPKQSRYAKEDTIPLSIKIKLQNDVRLYFIFKPGEGGFRLEPKRNKYTLASLKLRFEI